MTCFTGLDQMSSSVGFCFVFCFQFSFAAKIWFALNYWKKIGVVSQIPKKGLVSKVCL